MSRGLELLFFVAGPIILVLGMLFVVLLVTEPRR